ncbi:MAG TPA: iron-sulfur cluster assembly protein, partial [Pirellulaceae bacterium]
EGLTIACPRHGAQFDLRSGKALTMPATESTARHDVKVTEGQVWVRLREGRPMEPTPTPTAPPAATAAATSPSGDAPVRTSPSPEMPLDEDHIREQLKKVVDPELFVNIIDLGLVYTVDVQALEDDQSKVVIEMTMTSPACPAGPQLISNSKMAVLQLPGVSDVEVKIVMDPPWTPDRMTDDARDQLGIF